MKFNSAAAFIAAGASLYLSTTPRTHTSVRMAHAAAWIVTAIGAVTLAEYVSGASFGIDDLFIRGAGVQGRMAPHTAVAFALAGAGLLSLDTTSRRAHWITLGAASGIAGAAVLAIGGHLYGREGAYRTAFFAAMSLHTAVAFVLLAFGMLAARPRRGVGRVLFSPTVTGLVARRWLVGALLVPLALGFFAEWIERAGILDPASASALFVGVITLILGTAVLAESAASHRLEAERLNLERDRQRLIVELEKALTEVRQLSGLLPICSLCKKIRDERGAWERLEEYISDHSQAQFSHSLCPECLERHYGDVMR